MKLIMLVGPPGSGKSTLAKKYEEEGYLRISQDDQGPDHSDIFLKAVEDKKAVLVDRMNFNKHQRNRYLDIAKLNKYETKIIVLHENFETCFKRAIERTDHPTIKDDKAASRALNFFFSKYERVEDNEANEVVRIWPDRSKEKVIICDLDGTLCDVEHRRHFVRPTDGSKKNWKAFFDGIPDDPINQWCKDIINNFYASGTRTIFCSGRDENQRKKTQGWLREHGVGHFPLYMRNRSDSRQDNITKEVILDFELLTRYEPYFFIDDRQQVVDMYRKRGYTVLQCDVGNF